jgi:hypothetical protein
VPLVQLKEKGGTGFKKRAKKPDILQQGQWELEGAAKHPLSFLPFQLPERCYSFGANG